MIEKNSNEDIPENKYFETLIFALKESMIEPTHNDGVPKFIITDVNVKGTKNKCTLLLLILKIVDEEDKYILTPFGTIFTQEDQIDSTIITEMDEAQYDFNGKSVFDGMIVNGKVIKHIIDDYKLRNDFLNNN